MIDEEQTDESNLKEGEREGEEEGEYKDAEAVNDHYIIEMQF